MLEQLIARIQRAANVPNLLDVLVQRLEPTDLQSLLLEVYRRTAGKVTPARVLEQYQSNRFVTPCPINPKQLAAFERLAWDLLPHGYVPVELSPVCPLGTHSALGTVDQNKVVSTIRNTEVVADATNVMALEAATQRRKLRQQDDGQRANVLLASSHRLVRAQTFSGPKSFAHFRTLCVCAAGRGESSFGFELTHLLQQLTYHLSVLKQFHGLGCSLNRFRVALTPLDHGPTEKDFEERVLTPLKGLFPEVASGIDNSRTSGRGYYRDLCFKIYAATDDQPELDVGDGGMTDWTQKLLSDRKERLLISALGVDRLCLAMNTVA